MTERYDELDPGVPLLLMPLRLETRSEQRADGWFLKVRAYPDDVSMTTLRRGLADGEVEAAKVWWRAAWSATPSEPDPWPALVAAVGPERAPWVAAAMRPTNPGDRGVAEPVFADPPLPEPDGSTPPRTALLPDALRVIVEQSGSTESHVGEPIPAQGVPTGSADGDVEALGRSLSALLTDAPSDDPLAWITDFTAAERVGLGVRVKLPHGDAPIQRVTVVGVRAGDPDEVAGELEALLTAHAFAAGAALPPVGTVTNNTPDTRAAWSRIASRPGAPPLDLSPVPSPGTAGERLAVALGLSVSTMTGWDGADHLGESWAEAMATGLWPVTWGGFLDRSVSRPLPGATRELARQHARRVRGRGPLPALRLGRQPYGLLPVTSLADFRHDDPAVAGIAALLERLGPLWRAAAADTVPHVGRGDLGEVLPEILGQSPVSRSLRVRRAVGLGGPLGKVAEKVDPAELSARTTLVRVAEAVLGLDAGTLGEPVALGVERLLGLPLADDADVEVLAAVLQPGGHGGDFTSVLQVLLALSEGQTRAALERLTERERWHIMVSRLRDAVGELGDDLVAIGSEALEAVGNGSFDEGERIRRAATAYDVPDAPWSADRFLRRFPVARLRPHPIDIARQQDSAAVAEAVAITLRAASAYADVREAIATVTQVASTAERARLLAETLDCASHRYDAWVTSLATRRLTDLRAARPSGVAVGAFGRVEDITVAPAVPVENPPDGVETGVLQPVRAGGVMAAPSPAHAATAAVLRGARLSHDPGDGVDGALEIDLTSTRVRAARSVLDGVRNGQPLGALLGYRFERDLHEATPDHRLNAYVPSLRTLAPLVAAKSTERVAVGAAPASLESVAASDVVDGVRLREIYLAERDPGTGDLPAGSSIVTRLAAAPPGFERYGVGAWSAPDATELGHIVTALKRLDALLDAVSDLLLAEGVHQLVSGDPTRSAAAMDAMAGDAVPAEPHVLTPPPSGTAFTHRLMVLTQARASSPRRGWTTTARASADPSLEAWCRTALGPATSVVLDAEPDGTPRALLSAVAMSALDLVAATGGSHGLLWARLRRVVPGLPEAPDANRPAGLAATSLTFLEAWVLAGSLRALLSGARPLLPDDLAMPGAAPVRSIDAADLRLRASRARAALAAVPASGTSRTRRLRVADQLAAFGIGGGVDPATLSDGDLASHVTALVAERAKRLESATAALAAYDDAPPAESGQAHARLSEVFAAVFADRLPVLAVIRPEAGPGTDPFSTAWTRPPSTTPDGAEIRPWLSTAARVRPAAARLAEALMVREAVRGGQRLRVVQLPPTGPDRWVGLPFADGAAPLDAVTSCIVDAPAGLQPWQRLAGLVVDGWSETVPRRRTTPDGPHDLVTTGMAVHANGPDARAPQSLLLAVTPDGEPWTWQRVAGIVDETFALARTRLVTLERAPLGGALLPAIWAQDWSLQGEPVIDPRLLSEFADLRARMPYVSELAR